MKQDIRSYALVKALALLLTVACAVGAVFSWAYCAYHWDSLFEQENFTDSILWNRAGNDKYGQLMEILNTYDQLRRGETIGYLEQKNLQERLEALSPLVSNFRYIIRDDNTGEILLSSAGEDSLAQVFTTWSNVRTMSPGRVYYSYREYDDVADITIFYNDDNVIIGKLSGRASILYAEGDTHRYALEYGVDARLLVQDTFWEIAHSSYSKGDIRVLYLAAWLTTVFFAGTVFLMCCAGRRREADTFLLNWTDKIPYDLYLFALGFAMVCAFSMGLRILAERYYYYYPDDSKGYLLLGAGGALLTVAFALFEAALMSTASRIKCRTLLRNTVTWRVCAWCGHLIQRIWTDLCAILSAFPLTFRTINLFAGYLLLNAFLAAGLFRSHSSGFYFLCLLGVNTVVLALMCRYTIQWSQVRSKAQAIVSGQPDTVIDTGNMTWFPALRQHAEALNDLGGAISTAVEEQLKSERMKAELITNVSHDLKTPLTSIINYVDLLKKEEVQGEKAQEYIEVLDRKSQRLKKLTEDLVEASKASTGTLAVNPDRLGVVQLVDQALGEYSAKFEDAQLTLVSTLPETEVYVNADGRHLWRIIDNLLGNCVKYTLPGTRVYLDVTVWDNWVTLSMKNISAQQLNIPADQLMERFVRGDESRTTEGSGLGLSIARSLTELQGGRFRLEVDGDLFKAVVILPEAR